MSNRKPHRDAPRKEPKTDWGGVADWYDRLVGDEGSEYQREVVLPGVIRLLAPKAGEAMLDIACGQGVLCRMLSERGVKMTGVDAAIGTSSRASRRSSRIRENPPTRTRGPSTNRSRAT